MQQTKRVNEKLPLEYPFKEALLIYLKRLGIFILVLGLNLALFGFLINETVRILFLVALVLFVVYLIYRTLPALVELQLSELKSLKRKPDSKTLARSEIIAAHMQVRDGKMSALDFATIVLAALNKGLIGQSVAEELLQEFGYKLEISKNNKFVLVEKR